MKMCVKVFFLEKLKLSTLSLLGERKQLLVSSGMSSVPENGKTGSPYRLVPSSGS